MSKYELFRNMNLNAAKTASANVAKFIENSLSSTTIYHLRIREPKKVVLTRDHKEGVIEIILFTYPIKGHKKVKKGDYIKHKRKNFLTYMEYDHPLSKDYSKYKILECNINIKVDKIFFPAAFFSGMRSFVNNTGVKVQDAMIVFENFKPVVVVKDHPIFKVNFRFLAAGEAFKVVNIDRISNPGIAYLSVEQAPLNVVTDNLEKNKVTTYQKPVEPDEVQFYKKGEIVTLSIIGGFVTFDKMPEIISRSSSEITFRVPYDIDQITITTKNLNGEDVVVIKEVI